jgi:hypothetical protein
MKTITKSLVMIIAVIALVSFVNAYPVGENYTVENSSVGVYTIIPLSTTDLAYPQELFYVIFGIGTILLLVNIFFICQRVIPASPMAISGVVGFGTYLVAAYMAPLTAKLSIVVTSTQIINVATYIFSPWVSYLCLGLATVNLLFFGYGVLRYFQMLAENHAYINNSDNQFNMYLEGR